MAEKPHINLIFIGHVDNGKSTTVGRLLYDTGALAEQEYRKIKAEADALGKGTFAFAYVMDNLKEERARGVTIDVAYKKFTGNKNSFTIIDAPGHKDFIKNMIKGTSQADAAVLVVTAAKGADIVGQQPQTKEHAFLTQVMGVKQIIVAINQMDTIGYDEKKYNEILSAMKKIMTGIGFKEDQVQYVPISAWEGENVAKATGKMAWYKGQTLVQLLDTLKQPELVTDKPLRFPIEDVYTIQGVGTVPTGKIVTGMLKVNDKIVIMPSGKTGEIKSIEEHHEKIDVAKPGNNIGVNIRGIEKKDISKGDVIGHVNSPPTVAKEFIAQVIVLNHPTAIPVGYTPVFHIHTAQVSCKLEEIQKKIDPKTGAVAEENPKFLKTGDAAIVKIVPLKPMVVEEFKKFPQLGRFAIRDMGNTVAAGIVLSVTPRDAAAK
ncbi:Elongation factor 1-alpha [uncultured archaeon]|nr:Elongation factor 1-alpha [uncultured archaeon]